MSKENATPIAKAPAVAAGEDLSDAIELAIDKEPGEEVRTVRVYDDHYRCNWWVPDKTPGPAYLNTGRISRSKFLKVTRADEKLVIVDMSIKA